MFLALLSAGLGLASSVSSALGQKKQAEGASAGVGLAMEAAREKALGYETSQFQSQFAATIARIQGSVGAAQLKANADIESSNVTLSAAMQAAMSRFDGIMAQTQADFVSAGHEIQGQAAKAAGQENMFRFFEELEYTQSSVQANVAKGGFVVNDNSSIGVSGLMEDIEAEGYLNGRQAYAAGQRKRNESYLAAAATRTEGNMAALTKEFDAEQAILSGNYTASAIKRKAALEASIFTMNKELEASARTLEASAYGDLARAALSYGAKAHVAEVANANAQKSSAKFGALTTILGGAASFAGNMPSSLTAGIGIHTPKSTVTSGASYG